MSSTNTFFGLSSGSLVQLPHLDVLATTATTFILECAGLTARSLVLKEGSRLFRCSNVLPRLFVGGQPVEAQLPFKSKRASAAGLRLLLLCASLRLSASALCRASPWIRQMQCKLALPLQQQTSTDAWAGKSPPPLPAPQSRRFEAPFPLRRVMLLLRSHFILFEVGLLRKQASR